ncbi:MAG: orotidine-5'-phosphate decarboxylase [Candidatus Paceibacterota bacterium]|jgi:orotidine-5'-phosphate decarboxylase
MSDIIKKYDDRAKAINSMVCVGLDSDIAKIPERFLEKEFPQFEFNKWIIDETHEYAAAYKPNSAFYEARGEQGISELKMTFDYLRENHPDIFTILDFKRGDIGNTNNGYVNFGFDFLGADSVTVQPYQGKEALAPFLERKDKCTIVLVKTSNPGSGEFQDLDVAGKPLWQHVAKEVATTWNVNNNLMIVMGATYPDQVKRAREITGEMTFLIPGTGAQGGDVEDFVPLGKNSDGRGMIINSSRGIIFSNDPKAEAMKLRDEIRSC